jgi:hypothetical protein
MIDSNLSRRALLGSLGTFGLPWLAACSTPLPLAMQAPPDASAAALLLESAQAHGLEAYRLVTDINVAYGGQWRPLIHRVQPEVVDIGYRGPSQERLMPQLGINAQAYSGPKGRKQVVWQRQPAQVAVWYDGQLSSSESLRQAAALVADIYGFFLLGPLWVVDRGLPWARSGTERVDGRLCDVVESAITPGFGFSPRDRVALCIDQKDRITRRTRFTLEGFPGTRGAVAETDTFDHQKRFGVTWPMRSYEEVVHPLRLPAHDWFITGLDVNRGYAAQAVQGPQFSGAAAAPAAPL